MKQILSLALSVAAFLPALCPAAGSSKIDWAAWELLPVHNDGRVMPLDTFARENVGKICGVENPRIDLRAQLPKGEYESAALADARALFPEGQAHKFHAAELLLSWMLEAGKWGSVPFIEAKHRELREFMELPLTNEAGDKIGFVSPNQLRDSEKFMQRFKDIAEREQAARAERTELRLNDIDQKVSDLAKALMRWQGLAFDGPAQLSSNRRFSESIVSAVQSWRSVSPQLEMFRNAGAEKTGLKEPVDRAAQAVDNIAQAFQSGQVNADSIDPFVRNFAQATQLLSDQFLGLLKRMKEHPPADGNPQKLSQMLEQIAGQVADVALAARNAQQALYESDKLLCVVPALNAAALESDRNPEDESRPWLDLYTLVFGSPAAIAAYPAADVEQVRQSFTRLAQIYPQRQKRPNDLQTALGQFSSSLRKLGEDVEPLRAQLPIHHRDDALLAYTQYPADGSTATEVRYNRVQPFQWAWIINLLATCLFGVYMIGIRRRSIFLVGLALLFAGLGVAAYGFSMRVAVTGWAPVTNMYETVIYVPFFVAALGAWFALLPVTWDGLSAAWRMTAVPGTWESQPLSSEEQQLMAPGGWSVASVLLLIPRAALAGIVFWVLAIAPYSAGGRTIINLLPNIDAGKSMPDFNDLMTWAVGWVVLFPAVWYVPRVIVSAMVALVTIPLSSRGRTSSLVEQASARWPFCLAATSIGFFGAALASFAPVLDDSFSPLQPVLRDNFWLLIHVLTIVSSYGAGALAWGLANIALAFYLFGAYRTPQHHLFAGHRPAAGAVAVQSEDMKRPPEQTAELTSYVYKAMQVAVVLLAAGTILGALWADVAWGRFWGWDPKEVWALISLLVYLAILHGRYAGLFGNFGLCFGAVLGFSAIVMSWYGVNFVLGVGLHSYGFGQGGQGWVFGAVGLNWLYLLAATLRFHYETQGTLAFWKRRPDLDPDSNYAETVA